MQSITTVLLSILICAFLLGIVMLFEMMRVRDEFKKRDQYPSATRKEIEQLLELDEFEIKSFHKN